MDAVQFHDMQVFMKGIFYGMILGSVLCLWVAPYLVRKFKR